MQNLPSNGLSAVRCDIIVGTRPEAIKLAPVIKALRTNGDDFLVRVVTSGQHGEICRSALAAFGLTADSELDIEPISGSLADTAGKLLRACGRRFADSRPDLILVQGDTTTAMAAALAGFYAQIPVAHVEAGLRSGELAHPFPEEANRQIIDAVSEILLPPTPQAQSNLSRAGFAVEKCPVTGNTVVDALQQLCASHPLALHGSGVEEADLIGRRLILVTMHRRESWGGDLEAICGAIREIAERRMNIVVALPVHPPECSETSTRTARRAPADQVIIAIRVYPVSGADAPRLFDPHRLRRRSRRGAFLRRACPCLAQDDGAARGRRSRTCPYHRYGS
jgi:UDP-N-acetylglucosamine 2-epimerase